MSELVKQIYKEYPIDGGCDNYFIGKDIGNNVIVIEITYHIPMGEGDAHYCDVKFSNSGTRRIFRPDTIDYFTLEEIKKKME